MTGQSHQSSQQPLNVTSVSQQMLPTMSHQTQSAQQHQMMTSSSQHQMLPTSQHQMMSTSPQFIQHQTVVAQQPVAQTSNFAVPSQTHLRQQNPVYQQSSPHRPSAPRFPSSSPESINHNQQLCKLFSLNVVFPIYQVFIGVLLLLVVVALFLPNFFIYSSRNLVATRLNLH